MGYTDNVNFSSTGNYGSGPEDEDDVYTVGEFKKLCESKMFIDFDGDGHPVKGKKADQSIWVKPSNLGVIPEDATHIVWYNR